jgi:hypothetical protein
MPLKKDPDFDEIMDIINNKMKGWGFKSTCHDPGDDEEAYTFKTEKVFSVRFTKMIDGKKVVAFGRHKKLIEAVKLAMADSSFYQSKTQSKTDEPKSKPKTDIVEKLRNRAKISGVKPRGDKLAGEAADTIEELKREIERLKKDKDYEG